MSATQQAAQLLDAVRIRTASLQAAKQRYAAQLAPDFHLFDYLRNDEMGVSRYLALLLDKRESHGQGDLFLRYFLAELGVCAEWAHPEELESIALEKQANGQRRLDIFLVFRHGVIGIENKPWADDQPDQLKDYAEFLKTAHASGNCLLVYICNGEPSEKSIAREDLEALDDAGHYCRLDFYQLADCLDRCAAFVRAPHVRLFTETLAGYIRRHINGELEVTEADELKSLILEKSEYMDAALRVSASIHTLKAELLTELKSRLEEALADGMTLVWDEEKLKRGRTYAGFGVKFNSAHKLHLRFEFGEPGLNSLEWGLCRNDSSIQLEPGKVDILHSAMQAKFGAGTKGPNWPWYPGQGPQDTRLRADERNWQTSAEPWLRIRDKSENGFVARIMVLAEEVKAALVDVDAAMR